MWAVGNCTLQDIVQRLRVAVLRLKLCQAQPESLLTLEVHHGIVVDRACDLNGVSVDGCICILNPVLLHAFHILVDSNLDRDLDNGLACLGEASLLCLLCLLQPHVTVWCHAIGCKRVDSTGQNQLHHFLVALRLLQFGSRHPNDRAGRDVLTGLVEHFLGFLVGRQLGQREPHLNAVWHALDCTAQHHSSLCLILKTDSLLPETHGVGDELQSLSKHSTLGLDILLSVGSIDPKTHAVRQGLHSLGHDSFCTGWLLKTCGLKPHILVVWAVLAALGDELPSRLNLTGNLFQTRCGNPTGAVLRVARDHALQQGSCLLDVANVSIRLNLECVQVRQVAFRVHDRLTGDTVHDPVKLHGQHGSTGLTKLVEVASTMWRVRRAVARSSGATWCSCSSWSSSSTHGSVHAHGRVHTHWCSHAHGRVCHWCARAAHWRGHAHWSVHSHRRVHTHWSSHAHRRVHSHR
mmetsp:Transcript_55026/g.98081  ORF Transcript_55026/g.98081 Transcript_55026/m.98081 type:complete len:463 (-) Transcript_55026:828-2216(-)